MLTRQDLVIRVKPSDVKSPMLRGSSEWFVVMADFWLLSITARSWICCHPKRKILKNCQCRRMRMEYTAWFQRDPYLLACGQTMILTDFIFSGLEISRLKTQAFPGEVSNHHQHLLFLVVCNLLNPVGYTLVRSLDFPMFPSLKSCSGCIAQNFVVSYSG